MNQRIAVVLALGALLLAISAVGGDELGPATPPGAHKTMTLKEHWGAIFGPIRPRDTVVTGVDAEGLAHSLWGEDRILTWREATRSGVLYVYRSRQEPDKSAGLLRVGVFADAGAALATLENMYNHMEFVPPPLRGVGDVAFASDSTLLLLNNNVVIRFSVPERSANAVQSVARRIAEELETGQRFVTRSKEVKPPRIVSVSLPERVRPGQEATGKIVLTEIDPEQALIGVDWGFASPFPTHIGPGKEPSITLHVPRDAQGEKKFTLVVATPTNVTATKEISIIVENAQRQADGH